MGFLDIAVRSTLDVYPMDCLLCEKQLFSLAFQYSEDSDNRTGVLVLDILCIFCGQPGQIDLQFPKLDLLEIRGQFLLRDTEYIDGSETEELQEKSVLESVYEILTQARSQ